MTTLNTSTNKQTAELGWQRQQRTNDIQRSRLNLEDIRRLDHAKDIRYADSQSHNMTSEKVHQRQLNNASSHLQNLTPRRDMDAMGEEWAGVTEDSLLFSQLISQRQKQDESEDSDSFNMQTALLSQADANSDTSEKLAEALAPYFKNTGKVALDVLIQLPRLGNIRVNATMEDSENLAISLAPEEEQCRQLLLSQQTRCSEGLSHQLGKHVNLTILDSEIIR